MVRGDSSESLKELNEFEDVKEWLREFESIEQEEHISRDTLMIDKSLTFLWNIAVMCPSSSFSLDELGMILLSR